MHAPLFCSGLASLPRFGVRNSTASSAGAPRSSTPLRFPLPASRNHPVPTHSTSASAQDITEPTNQPTDYSKILTQNACPTQRHKPFTYRTFAFDSNNSATTPHAPFASPDHATKQHARHRSFNEHFAFSVHARAMPPALPQDYRQRLGGTGSAVGIQYTNFLVASRPPKNRIDARVGRCSAAVQSAR